MERQKVKHFAKFRDEKKNESLGTKNDLLWKFRDKNDILPYLNGTIRTKIDPQPTKGDWWPNKPNTINSLESGFYRWRLNESSKCHSRLDWC